jgi:hypothetical protein
MAKVTMPPYFEVRYPNVPKGRVKAVSLTDVLNGAAMRQQVIASLLAKADRLEAEAGQARDIARELERLAARAMKEAPPPTAPRLKAKAAPQLKR